jgi:large subunit ribosomal protein L3
MWGSKMSIGLIGQKCGMTRIFTDEGASVAVTVVEVNPNRIVQIKTDKTDGYNAIKVTHGKAKNSAKNKPIAGLFAKVGVEPGLGCKEFRLGASDRQDFSVNQELKVTLFAEGDLVDVTSKSIGKGFAGTIKRHHFTMGDATHGNSLSHRAPGSIGQRQTPGRVFPGKKMAGHLGNVKRTIQNQRVIKIDAERNLILIKGNVPGAKGAEVIIKPAVKVKKVKGNNNAA